MDGGSSSLKTRRSTPTIQSRAPLSTYLKSLGVGTNDLLDGLTLVEEDEGRHGLGNRPPGRSSPERRRRPCRSELLTGGRVRNLLEDGADEPCTDRTRSQKSMTMALSPLICAKRMRKRKHGEIAYQSVIRSSTTLLNIVPGRRPSRPIFGEGACFTYETLELLVTR